MRGERFHFTSEHVPDLAVAIIVSRHGTHTGIIHRAGGKLFLLDQRWHEDLGNAPCDGMCPCVIPNLLPEEINDVTGLCRLIATRREQNPRDPAPYALYRNPLTRISAVTGEILLSGGLGLTCSTFVLTIFEAARVPILDLTGWPRRPGDDDRHRELVALMRRTRVREDHVRMVEAELPCIRVRPEEVAAAGMADAMPANHDQAECGGRWILELLTPDWAHASI
jgi:hypothetical protein